LRLWISAPANDKHGVVQLLPFDASLVESRLRDRSVLFLQKTLGLRAQLRKLDHLLMQVLHALVRHDTRGVHVAIRREVDLALDGTAVHNLLHHRLLSGGTVASTNELHISDLCDRLTL